MKSIANLHVLLNYFENDSRVLKETKSIANSELINQVYIAALWKNDLKEFELLDHNRLVWRIPLITKKLAKNRFLQLIKYFEWLIKIIGKFKNKNIKVIHCHDLSTLAVGVLFRLFLKSRVIYDAHEYETEIVTLDNKSKYLLKLIESILIKFADEVITVSQGIAEAYSANYNIKTPSLILNNPPYKALAKQNIFRMEFNIPADKTIFLYQGGLTAGRGLRLLMEVFGKSIRKDIVLILMGYGSLEKEVVEAAHRYENIFFHPAIPPDLLMPFTASADIGVCFIKKSCLSYYYCLPNKLFEYAMAGLPVLVNDLPEVKKMVSEFNCGTIIEEDTFNGINNGIDRIMAADLAHLGENALKLASEYNWENQEKCLISIYKKMLS